MDNLPSSLLLNTFTSAIGVVFGLCVHLSLFIHGEWHVQAPTIFLLHATLYALLSTGAVVYYGSSVGKLWTAGLIMSICYLVAMLTSIIIYRIRFHRLGKAGFNGPFYMRVSKLFHVWNCRTSKNHLLLDRLQKQYGDFIRTGRYIVSPDIHKSTAC